jgi:hypothetical protein
MSGGEAHGVQPPEFCCHWLARGVYLVLHAVAGVAWQLTASWGDAAVLAQ